MIISNQQLAIHLATVRNLTSYTSGKYQLRVTLWQQTANSLLTATPVSVIQDDPFIGEGGSECEEQAIITRVFSLKSGTDIDLDEIYIFKLDSSVTSRQEPLLKLGVELIHVESDSRRNVGYYSASIGGIRHEYLEIDFCDSVPCQVKGSLHRCAYKYSFKEDEMGMTLEAFCQKYYKEREEQILVYLQEQGRRHYQALAEYVSLSLGEEVEIDCISTEEPIVGKIRQSQIDIWEQETEIDIESYEARTKRRRIFSTTKNHLSEKFCMFEKVLHDNAEKIYGLWREFLPKLFSLKAAQFLQQKAHLYRQRLVEKIQESVSSFQGSWDQDLFGQENHLRNKLAEQLRNKAETYDFTSTKFDTSVNNDSFFSVKRPILFEETTKKSSQEVPQASELFIVLVHGLGACRMDMQKIKTELKRYYEKKVRILCSTCNQGRTQGNIDAMGMRLASEVDYELSKFTNIPKICMLGHSMGGLIIRSALPRLEKYKPHFHSLITLSSPHLGYGYSDSAVVDVGLWFMSTVKKCTSLLEMSMKDEERLEDTFLYRLSEKPGLEWFKKITFMGSHNDHYVPYYSARVQKHQESLVHEKSNVKKGKVHCEMVDRLLSRVSGSLRRVDVNFCITEQNIDNFIGRAAHISFINNSEMIRTMVLAGKHFFF